QLSAAYVMLCSLGLEASSSQRIRAALERFVLVADSDVVISLLCQGEENHSEVERIVNGWRQLGGRWAVTVSVLEEVAYHAWISENEFSAMANQLGRGLGSGGR